MSKPQQVVSKPAWNTAPAWAQYLAQDKSGQWWWYENKPQVATGVLVSTGEWERCTSVVDWKETLEERPEE
jgi:hypothetical protein